MYISICNVTARRPTAFAAFRWGLVRRRLPDPRGRRPVADFGRGGTGAAPPGAGAQPRSPIGNGPLQTGYRAPAAGESGAGKTREPESTPPPVRWRD